MDPIEAAILIKKIVDNKYPDGYTDVQKRSLRDKIKSFTVVDRILYHCSVEKKKTEQSDGINHVRKKRVIVGKEEKQNVLESLHGGPGGGHFGMEKTFGKIAELYWWKGYQKDVRDFVSVCEKCQKANPLNKPVVANLHPIPVSNKLFQRWCLDLIGPLNVTKQENRYIAVATEYLTRWAEVKAIPNKDACSVAEFVLDIIYTFGLMEILQHDQGTEFCNTLNRHICDTLAIKKAVSSAYHPQTNGLTERYNQTLCIQLQKHVNENSDNWDLYIKPISFAYRTSIQSSIKKTPYEMMFGISARLPIELDLPGLVDESDEDPIGKRIQDLTTVVVQCRTQGLQSLREAQERQKLQYDLKHKGPFYEVGQLVLKKNARKRTRQGDKIGSSFLGPYEIIEVMGKGSYRLKDPKTDKELQQKVSSSNLKQFNQVEENVSSKCDGNDDSDVAFLGGTISPITFTFVTVNETWQKIHASLFEKPVKKAHSFHPTIKFGVFDKNISRPVRIIGDGNCFFRSISYELFGTQEFHKLIREKVCQFLITNGPERKIVSEKFSTGLILGHETSVDYLANTKMQSVGTWATEVEVFIAATLLQTTILVFGPFLLTLTPLCDTVGPNAIHVLKLTKEEATNAYI